jgi:hypothetical protein
MGQHPIAHILLPPRCPDAKRTNEIVEGCRAWLKCSPERVLREIGFTKKWADYSSCYDVAHFRGIGEKAAKLEAGLREVGEAPSPRLRLMAAWVKVTGPDRRYDHYHWHAAHTAAVLVNGFGFAKPSSKRGGNVHRVEQLIYEAITGRAAVKASGHKAVKAVFKFGFKPVPISS